MTAAALSRRLVAEGMGTGLLAATVVGSGLMAEALAAGNGALALLGNTLATAAMLAVLVSVFGPVSGAHFNPAVSLIMVIARRLPGELLAAYVAAQVAGGLIGTLMAHVMFDLPLIQIGQQTRSGVGQWFSEGVATFGLLVTIIGTMRARPSALPCTVALYIAAAYWFTASTSFANPAITIARAFTDSFSGIAPADAPAFIAAQITGALAGFGLMSWMLQDRPPEAA